MAKLNEVYSEKQFKKFPPILICNITKEQEGNKKIYSRSLPLNGYNTNTPDFRSSFKVCENYKNMNTVTNEQKSLQSKYAKNVDKESGLRKVEPEKYPPNKRNELIDGDNYLKQLLYSLKPNCKYTT